MIILKNKKEFGFILKKKKKNMQFYKNGNYVVCIMDDGTKIRKTEEEDFIPSFAENTDVKLTSKCSIGCPFCYEGCTSSGKHGDLFKYEFINGLHPYTEIALNGNDMDHPDLEKFLVFLKEQRVFANITLHQKQFLNNFDVVKTLVKNKLIFGIGVSYNHYDEDFINKVKEFPNAVIHTINGILTKEDIDNLKGHDLKVLVLGYKDLKRGSDYLDKHHEEVAANINYLYSTLPTIINENWFKLISFDNLAIEQLQVKRLLSEDKWEEFYMGDDGNYTFYIDMVEGKFAKNSLSQERYDIGDKTIDEMFNVIKGK